MARILLRLNYETVSTREGGRTMLTTGLGVILATLVYGGLLVMFMFLLGQLLPIIYLFVVQEL